MEGSGHSGRVGDILVDSAKITFLRDEVCFGWDIANMPLSGNRMGNEGIYREFYIEKSTKTFGVVTVLFDGAEKGAFTMIILRPLF